MLEMSRFSCEIGMNVWEMYEYNIFSYFLLLICAQNPNYTALRNISVDCKISVFPFYSGYFSIIQGFLAWKSMILPESCTIQRNERKFGVEIV